MSDYIEEMMKIVEAERTLKTRKCGTCPYVLEDCGSNYCESFKYPDFTPKKQLEIIKLMALANYEITIAIEEYCTYLFATPSIMGGDQITAEDTDFCQALAQLTIKMIKAGKLNKEEIRKVLQMVDKLNSSIKEGTKQQKEENNE